LLSLAWVAALRLAHKLSLGSRESIIGGVVEHRWLGGVACATLMPPWVL
jgi:hypothetical protein